MLVPSTPQSDEDWFRQFAAFLSRLLVVDAPLSREAFCLLVWAAGRLGAQPSWLVPGIEDQN